MKKATKKIIAVLGGIGGVAWTVFGLTGLFGEQVNIVEMLSFIPMLGQNIIYLGAGVSGAILGYMQLNK